MHRILLAGVHSGSGKTTITCAVLQALVNRGLRVSSFKCGPDYIDPMFHGKAIGTRACNLDGFFCDGNQMRYLVAEHGGGSDISVIEGVMGYYDGVGEVASTYQVACETKTPVILVVDCKGMSRSIGAVVKGFLTFEADSQIKGCIFNRLPESLVPMAKDLCHKLGVEYIGRFPVCPQYQIESRHLGLVTAGELRDIKDKLQGLAEVAEAHLDLERVLHIAGDVGELVFDDGFLPEYKVQVPVKVAVARDAAFCFYYEDNLKLFERLGAELVEFSPLRDKQAPLCDGMVLGGGYPELYAERLSENVSMRESVARQILEGVPLVAECGGFLYLHRQLEDDKGKSHPMAGVICEEAFRTNRLQRFGYVKLTARKDTLLCDAGEQLLAHEFHYWDSTNPGSGYMAEKASNGVEYLCAYGDKQMYAGFAHLHFYGNPKAAVRFLKACERRARGQGDDL